MIAFRKACYAYVKQDLFYGYAAGGEMCASYQSSSRGYSYATAVMDLSRSQHGRVAEACPVAFCPKHFGVDMVRRSCLLVPFPASHIVLLHRPQRPARLVMVLQQHD